MDKSYLYDKDKMTDREKEIAETYKAIGNEHKTPSPETRKTIAQIKKYMQDNLVTKELFEEKFKDLKENLDLHFINIGGKFKSNDDEHDKIEDKINKINDGVLDFKLWKIGLAFAWSVVTVMFPVLFYYFMENHNKDMDIKIMQAIERNNDEYFEEVK